VGVERLTALARSALIVAVATAGLAQSGEEDARARQRVELRLAEWRAGKFENAQELTDALVGLGRLACLPLCHLLDNRPPDLPVEAVACAVARLGSPPSFPTLIRLAACAEDENRIAAVGALGLFESDQVLPHLTKALDDGALGVAERAESALLATSRPQERVALALSAAITSNSEKSRPALVLARLGGEKAHELLLWHLSSCDERRCLAALQGLRVLAIAEDGEAILELLKETQTLGIRKEACLVLGRINCKAAVRELINLLEEKDEGLAANAYWALRRITGQILKPDPEVWEFWWNRVGRKG
jgi:HEAT repeat protein